MRTLLDLTGDDSPSGGPCMPEWSHIVSDGDEVVLMLAGAIELRFTYSQFVEFAISCNRWVFIDRTDEVRLEDEEYCLAAEHQELRAIITEMLGDAFGEVEVPALLRGALKHRVSLSQHLARPWQDQDAKIRSLMSENEDLRAQLGKRARRKKTGR